MGRNGDRRRGYLLEANGKPFKPEFSVEPLDTLYHR
jgi:hypothetical protein